MRYHVRGTQRLEGEWWVEAETAEAAAHYVVSQNLPMDNVIDCLETDVDDDPEPSQ